MPEYATRERSPTTGAAGSCRSKLISARRRSTRPSARPTPGRARARAAASVRRSTARSTCATTLTKTRSTFRRGHMPRGVPGTGKGARRVVTEQHRRLLEARAEIDERLAVLDAKAKGHAAVLALATKLGSLADRPAQHGERDGPAQQRRRAGRLAQPRRRSTESARPQDQGGAQGQGHDLRGDHESGRRQEYGLDVAVEERHAAEPTGVSGAADQGARPAQGLFRRVPSRFNGAVGTP